MEYPADTAILSSENDYTVFQFGNQVLRFQAPYSLEKYTKVKEWDQGYIVVMTKYRHNDKDEEEYIDLLPVLKLLYIDADEFLKPIKRVVVAYDREVMN